MLQTYHLISKVYDDFDVKTLTRDSQRNGPGVPSASSDSVLSDPYYRSLKVNFRSHLAKKSGEEPSLPQPDPLEIPPFACRLCGQGFLQKCHLTRHRSRSICSSKAADVYKNPRCTICGTTFTHQTSLGPHCARFCDGPQVGKCSRCPYCDYVVDRPWKLPRHVRSKHRVLIKSGAPASESTESEQI